MRTGIVLVTRDLRIRDNPALHGACGECERVVPLFVLDDAVLAAFGAANRVAFLLEALRDLDASLKALGGSLVVRRGEVAVEVARVAEEVGATVLFLAEDVSTYARRREQRLRDLDLEVRSLPGVTVIPPGEVTPSGGGDAFAVFTPYWNRWRAQPRRAVLEPPAAVALPEIDPGRVPDLAEVVTETVSPRLPEGGETLAETGSTRGSKVVSASMRVGGTTSPTTRLHGCRRTFGSAVSRRSRSPSRREYVPAERRSSASCAGATSTTSSSLTGPSSRTRT